MSWQTQLSWQSAKARSQILAKIRQFFDSRGVIEVETPLVSSGTVTDVHLEAFSTRYQFLADADNCDEFYLQTSPEFAMKRLLASGYGAIYQICKAFRHEPYGRYHNPEFTMLEWYQPCYDHHQLMDEVAELLISVLACNAPTRLTYQTCFLQYTGIDPLSTNLTQLKAYLAQSERLEPWLAEESDLDTLLQFIFATDVETKIAIEQPVFVYDFPASQAALAKISLADPRVAHRFECYYQGIELANGFNELTDGSTQLLRFEQDNKQRLKKGLMTRPIDRNFIAALTQGLPACAGVALGVDRLIMLALSATDIKEVITFTISDA